MAIVEIFPTKSSDGFMKKKKSFWTLNSEFLMILKRIHGEVTEETLTRFDRGDLREISGECTM